MARFEPSVKSRYLILLAGFVWLVVGAALGRVAARWLLHTGGQFAAGLGLAGAVLAVLIHTFGFSRLVDRNVERIRQKPAVTCAFGFQSWKSYLLIMVMITMGVFLRSSPMPKHYLAVVYAGFGGAMVLSSIRYFRKFLALRPTSSAGSSSPSGS